MEIRTTELANRGFKFATDMIRGIHRIGLFRNPPNRISRSKFGMTLSLLIGGIVFLGCTPNSQLPTVKPYNVLFIVVDDLRPELGAYGADYIVSPNIDRLAAKSLVFEKAYCQAPICSPSRMSFLSGLRPNETNINNNNTPIRKKLPDVVTLPQHFKANGYQTQAYGKVFHQGIGDTASWNYFNDRPKHREVYQLEKNTSINDVNEKFKRGRAYEDADVPDSLYSDGIIVNRALKALDNFEEEQPFFLAVGFLKPHLPFLAPKKYWDLYDEPRNEYQTVWRAPKASPSYAMNNAGELRRYFDIPKEGPITERMGDTLFHGYYACVSYMDAQVGKLLDKLEEKKLSENTIVVLFGDHGYKLGDFNEWCKDTHYELDLRVPLIIHHPDKPSSRTQSMTELIDVYPTLVSGAGLDLPNQALSGTNLMPLFDDSDTHLKSFSFAQRPRKKIYGYSVRSENHRLVKWVSKNNPDSLVSLELYDYNQSPIEVENVANRQETKAIQNELMQTLKEEIGI